MRQTVEQFTLAFGEAFQFAFGEGRAIGTFAIAKESVAEVGIIAHVKPVKLKASGDNFGGDGGGEEGVFFHGLGR